jgi:predicted Zn finger-like uncharacterized protein
MIVTCEGCETSFHVKEQLLNPSGSKVRCSKCRHVFVAYPPVQEADPVEPLVLTDEMPEAAAEPEAAQADEPDMKLDPASGGAPSEEAASADSEMDFELPDLDPLEVDLDAPVAAGAGGSAGGDPGLDLDLDLDFDLNEAGQLAPEPVAGEATAAPSVAESAALAAGDEQEIDFNLDAEPLLAPEPVDELPALDELEINLADLDEASEPQAARTLAGGTPAPQPAAEEAGPDLDFDLDSLSLEEPAEPLAAAGPTQLADMEAKPQGKTAPPQEVEDSLPFDLDLAMEEGPVAAAHKEGSKEDGIKIDELDLSDLEDMLEGTEDAPAAKEAAPQSEAIDFELDLGDEVAAEDKAADNLEELDLSAIIDDDAPRKAAAGLADDDLAVALDVEGHDKAEAPHAAAPPLAADELDFSDMADILPPGGAAAGTPSEARQEAERLRQQEPAAAEASASKTAADDGLLLDLETLLEDGDAEAAAKSTANAGDMEVEIEPVQRSMENALLHDEPDYGLSPTSGLGQPGAGVATDDFSTDEFTASDLSNATSVVLDQPVEMDAPVLVSAGNSGARKLGYGILGILLLAVAALVVPKSLGIHVPYLSDLDIKIPYLSDLLGSQPADPAGNLKISPVTESISAEFVNNPGAGTLCVITGQVRNNYEEPRSHIQLTAKLYTKSKALAKTETVYAGNVLPVDALQRLDAIAIISALKNEAGRNNSNMNVQPGKAVPFMAVFFNLPKDLDEFSVEVASSSK